MRLTIFLFLIGNLKSFRFFFKKLFGVLLGLQQNWDRDKEMSHRPPYIYMCIVFPYCQYDFSLYLFIYFLLRMNLHWLIITPFHSLSSVQFSHSIVSDSLRPHESQHARPPCPSPTPRDHWDSCPWSQWCHPAISSFVVLFPSCPQSLPASESFPMSQLFSRGGQSTRVSALASFLPKKSQGWSPSEWTGWISLQPRDSQESSPTPQFKSINSSALSLLHSPTLTSIHDHKKNHSFD